MKFIYLVRTITLITVPILGMYFGIRNIDFFDYLLTEMGLASWSFAPYLSRLFLGLLPACILLSFATPKHSNKLFKLYALIAFAIGSISLYAALGLEVDRCYFCFFEKIRISPLQASIWLLLSLIAFFINGQEKVLKGAKVWGSLLAIVCMALPFVLNYPPSWAIYGEVGNKAVEISVPMDRILSKNSIYSRLIDADKLIKGEPLVCFASLTCPFCTRAATKLHILRKRNPDANCLLVLTGYPNQLERFSKRTQSSNVPCLVLNDSLFASITEGKVPRIFKLKGGKAIREFEYWAMDDQSLK